MIVVIMGVSGSGKTTVGSLLAEQLQWQFSDADDFHSLGNKEKIREGIPLSDQDREPWLEALHKAVEEWIGKGNNVVLACSALKKSYREKLGTGAPLRFVYLKGSYDLISRRLKSRQGHFATESILASQFASLEEPDDALVVDISQATTTVVKLIRQAFHLI